MEACAQFREQAVYSPDGWRPRHFLLMPAKAQQVDHVMIYLRLKVTGAFRAINVFASLYRVWCKLVGPALK
eukprot:1427702-Lingulodinium_polyedra.AAC.1